ncbi:MAG: nickel-responsive transcriptional regulator NikR [gamma proteobacterium symbiont of Stewartia floridana]|nr:nickel-responsive transcriptional regulator NikR [Candidatus Thiodiazotropha taylori]MCG7962050.1 nickel-responsive transcriptional regulator NikR [Candidatus Thiodiazotropha endolucinida]RLW55975.1 MAG: nickel-responsive transcriptional regulator NikR [gamma proteobacterium symbiont of Stewartia floridana]MCG7896190.1 nickel-responsive transcriptional regulator NikR [Candidatus Thiodiazotropha taylori]MCG7911401.1 nickel-responsive transcriptional regulator NikR [Candidatus Thiodiazotropha 
MQRMTITLDDDLVNDFEKFLSDNGYQNRSEAIRDLLRERIDGQRLKENPSGNCLANLTYVFNHHERNLANRLTESQHAHHDLNIATLHVHLDHDNCMESVVLRGPIERVQAFANATIAQPGVRHGNLYMVPAKIAAQTHQHGSGPQPHRHVHVQPNS